MSEAKHSVVTVGHSNHTLDKFIALLQQHGVTVVADVRSTPYSRFNPTFNREAIESELKARSIAYIFLGRELGARSEDTSCYENGRVQYDRLGRTDLFREGIERVVRGAARHRIALMCSEREPLHCHRALLVARLLDEQGIAVSHIHADGRLEPHNAAMRRLLELVGLQQPELFRSQSDRLEEGLKLQEARVAYLDKNMASKDAVKAR